MRRIHFPGMCAPAMTVVLDTAFFHIEYQAGHSLIRVARTSQPFRSLAECKEEHERIIGALDRFRSGYCLLFDPRQAPARKDPLLERLLRGMVPSLCQGFSRVAFLMNTAVGRLQAERVVLGALGETSPGSRCKIFDDEKAALDWLIHRRSSAPPRP